MRMDYTLDPPGGPFQNMFNRAWGLATAGQTLEPWLRATARGNLEALTLMNRRAQAYVELPLRLCQCRSPQDVANEQMRFWQTMAQQYTESSQRIFGSWTELAQQDANPERERDYITFPEPEETERGSREGGPNERRAA